MNRELFKRIVGSSLSTMVQCPYVVCAKQRSSARLRKKIRNFILTHRWYVSALVSICLAWSYSTIIENNKEIWINSTVEVSSLHWELCLEEQWLCCSYSLIGNDCIQHRLRSVERLTIADNHHNKRISHLLQVVLFPLYICRSVRMKFSKEMRREIGEKLTLDLLLVQDFADIMML